MGWTNNQFTGELVIPEGATSGPRIEINVNGSGKIEVYDINGDLAAELTPDTNGITGLITYETRSGDDYYSSLEPIGLTLAEVGQAQPGHISYLNNGGGQYEMFISSGGDAGTGPSQINLYSETGVGAGDSMVDILASTINLIGPMEATNVFDEYNNNNFGTFTPTVTNGGTVTWTTQTGSWVRLGKMVFVNGYLVVNNAGSGATPINIAGPVTLRRTLRQTIGAHVESMTAGNNGSCRLLSFTSGSGATWDRLRNSTNGSISGADLLAGGLITFEGWCIEA